MFSSHHDVQSSLKELPTNLMMKIFPKTPLPPREHVENRELNFTGSREFPIAVISHNQSCNRQNFS